MSAWTRKWVWGSCIVVNVVEVVQEKEGWISDTNSPTDLGPDRVRTTCRWCHDIRSALCTPSLIVPKQNYCLWCHKQQYKASVLSTLFYWNIFVFWWNIFQFFAETFLFNSVYFRRMTDMMIPSEMPVLSQQRSENGHSSFPDNQNVFQNPDLFRSGIFSQLGSDQMQILQNLQQMGQRQKEVGGDISRIFSVQTDQLHFLITTGLTRCFCLVKTSQEKQKLSLLQTRAESNSRTHFQTFLSNI